MIIDIYADVVCPWCYIGKHRLEQALAQRPAFRFECRWQPFQLNPGIPKAGLDRAAYLAAKFGGTERASQIYAVIDETARRDGLPIALDRIRRTPNTLDAHRLVRLADRHGLAKAMMDRLFKAYFVEGEDIGSPEVLERQAAQVGLDPTEARTFLQGDGEARTVRGIEVVARRLGIQAVPSFIFDQRFALAGAQEPHAILPLLDLAADERLTPAVG